MKLSYPKGWYARNILENDSTEIGAGSFLDGTEPPEDGDMTVSALDNRFALARFVSLWRRQRGWTIEQLARESGIPPDKLLEIERVSGREPVAGEILKLAPVLNIPPHNLVELARLVEAKSCTLQEDPARFAPHPDDVPRLTDAELEALDEFVAALTRDSDVTLRGPGE